MRTLTYNERILIIFKRREAGLTGLKLSNQILMSKSNLSRIENGIIMASEDNIKLLENRFGIDLSLDEEPLNNFIELSRRLVYSLIFYRIFEEYPQEWFESPSKEITKSVAYPMLMLIKLFVYSVKNIEMEFVKKYIKVFEKMIKYFNPYYQKIFYISKMNYLYFLKKYNEALNICEFIETEFEQNDLIDSFLFHVKAIIYGCLGKTETVIEILDQAIIYSNNSNNQVRLIALFITKANCRRLMKDYKLALEQDFQTLEYTKVHNVHIYDYILLRNIAWTYYLMDDYENAIKRYKIAEELDIDDDLCFITAYCYFKLAMDCESPSQKLDLRIKCKEYLNKGRKSKNSGIAFPYLIDWLELMLNKKYSLKAEQKLLYCLKKHETTMHVDSRNNIYKFLIEHYEYHQDSKNADYYRKKLQNG